METHVNMCILYTSAHFYCSAIRISTLAYHKTPPKVIKLTQIHTLHSCTDVQLYSIAGFILFIINFKFHFAAQQYKVCFNCLVHLIIGHALLNDIGLKLLQRKVGALVFSCLPQFIPMVCTLS